MVFVALLPEWLSSERYLTLATWGLVIATFMLYIDGKSKSKEQRARWEKEDQDRARDLSAQHERWRKEDEIRARVESGKLLEQLRSQFDLPEMRRARSKFAHALFDWVKSGRDVYDSFEPPRLKDIDTSASYPDEKRLLEFFQRLNALVEQKAVSIESVEIAFGSYIAFFERIVGGRFDKPTEGIRDLAEKLRISRSERSLQDPDPKGSDWYWFHEIDRNYFPKRR